MTSWNPSSCYFRFLSNSSICLTDLAFFKIVEGTLNFVFFSKTLLKFSTSAYILLVTSDSVMISRALKFFCRIYFNFSYIIYRCFSWACVKTDFSDLELRGNFVSAHSIEFSSEFGLPYTPQAFSFFMLKYLPGPRFSISFTLNFLFCSFKICFFCFWSNFY